MIKYTKSEAEKYEEGRILSESQPSTSSQQQEEDKNKEDDKPIFNTMDYIDIRKDQRFKAATLKEDVEDTSEALMITLRMLYENQKKILSNQELFWCAINQRGPDDVMKHDIAKTLDKIAHGFISAANNLY